MTEYHWIRVGQPIKLHDGSGYRGVITYVDEFEEIVRHASVFTGKEYEWDYVDFPSKYQPDEERA